MSLAGTASGRARILREVLMLTPRPEEELDIPALGAVLRRRQELLAELAAAPAPRAAAPTAEEAQAEKACARLIAELRERDAALHAKLERARGETARLLHRVRSRAEVGSIFDQAV
jgi:hypothetical protein